MNDSLSSLEFEIRRAQDEANGDKILALVHTSLRPSTITTMDVVYFCKEHFLIDRLVFFFVIHGYIDKHERTKDCTGRDGIHSFGTRVLQTLGE